LYVKESKIFNFLKKHLNNAFYWPANLQ
jgi:hypothetical protein